MNKKTKKIVILTEVELRKTISRLASEIIEKVKELENLLLVGIPTRGIELTEVLEKELFSKTGLRVRKGTIDPTFYRDDQNRVGTRVILNEVELRKTISRLTSEIIEKVKKLDNLLLVGVPTRGIELTEVLEKELFSRTGLKVRKGTIDPTFYRDDQNRVGTRLIQAADIPTPIEKQEILLIDDVIYTGRTIRAAMDALYSWGRPQRVMLLVMVDRGHRELPIQPDFCGKRVLTRKNESISLRLKNVDNEEGVFLE